MAIKYADGSDSDTGRCVQFLQTHINGSLSWADRSSSCLPVVSQNGQLPNRNSGGRKSINVTPPRGHPGPHRRVTPPFSVRK